MIGYKLCEYCQIQNNNTKMQYRRNTRLLVYAQSAQRLNEAVSSKQKCFYIFLPLISPPNTFIIVSHSPVNFILQRVPYGVNLWITVVCGGHSSWWILFGLLQIGPGYTLLVCEGVPCCSNSYFFWDNPGEDSFFSHGGRWRQHWTYTEISEFFFDTSIAFLYMLFWNWQYSHNLRPMGQIFYRLVDNTQILLCANFQWIQFIYP